MTLKVLDLFAGAGGFTIAGELAGGYETVAFCEIDKHARKVLAKNWPNVSIFEDVTKLKASDIDGTIDVITGGFPCQDLSSAGSGAGIGAGTRSGLFREMLRLACEVRERQGRLPYIIFENVARLLSGPTEAPGEWFGEFLWALAEVGYDAEWFCITAASVGAPHMRERVCVVAYPSGVRWPKILLQHVYGISIEENEFWKSINDGPLSGVCSWEEWERKSGVLGVDYGLPGQSHRLKLMGNAIVPQVFAIPMRALREAHLTSTNTMPIQHNTTSKEDIE